MTDLEAALDAIGDMMNNLKYIQMLLGLAVSRIPGGLEVGAEDYQALAGKGLALSSGDRPGSFKLQLKELPAGTTSGSRPSVMGEA